MKITAWSLAGLVLVSLAATSAAADTQMLGPTPYRSFDDSPFKGLGLADFQLEDFEDGLFNVPGVQANVGLVASTLYPHDIIDSVDGDDGNPNDGTCLNCDSYFYLQGSPGIVFSFTGSPDILPTHVGIVWTDGFGLTSFEAFDADGQSLGIVGPVALADSTHMNTTAEDRFFGVINPAGISAIHVWNTSGGIEVDHLQFGGHVVPCNDADGDGFGFPGASACPQGPAEDCDDSSAATHPGAVEIFDGLDNNCDGVADEGLDADGDGVPDTRDECNGTTRDFGVGPDGCAVCSVSTEPPMVCDPDTAQTHGEFVKCVAAQCRLLVQAGKLTSRQCAFLVQLAAEMGTTTP